MRIITGPSSGPAQPKASSRRVGALRRCGWTSYDEASTEALVLFHTADESCAHAVLVRVYEVLSVRPEYNT